MKVFVMVCMLVFAQLGLCMLVSELVGCTFVLVVLDTEAWAGEEARKTV
jgi:hypothetical protein